MNILNAEEHVKCFNYEASDSPQIEVINCKEGDFLELINNINGIVFFIHGKHRVKFHDYPEYLIDSNCMIFVPSDYRCDYTAVSDTQIVVFRLYNHIKLCESYYAENLTNTKENKEEDFEGINEEIKSSDNSNVLVLLPRVDAFIKGLVDYIDDGIKCKHFFDMKIKEFFLLLRAYYTKYELNSFLNLILSKDLAFSEYVRLNRGKYATAAALAESMHLTHKQLARRFRETLNITPYQWIKEGKKERLHYEITATKKPLKQIASENGYTTMAQFNKFCKKELGKNPGELRNETIKR